MSNEWIYVEIAYLDGPPMLASIDSRTPNKVRGHGDIIELRQRGYTIVPLVRMTSERRSALTNILHHEPSNADIGYLQKMLDEADIDTRAHAAPGG